MAMGRVGERVRWRMGEFNHDNNNLTMKQFDNVTIQQSNNKTIQQ